jgi:sugar phosphate isomerase/epimerase
LARPADIVSARVGATETLCHGGLAVYVACSTLCFAGHPLDSALRTIRDLNFAKVDLAIQEDGPHLKPSELVGDLTPFVQKLKAANVPIAAFNVRFARREATETRRQLRGVCRLARLLSVPLVSVPAPTAEMDMEHEVATLQDWVSIAETEGIILTVETSAHTITADPAATLELCKRVPGLGLTLDPSHYIAHPGGPINHDSLYPYVRHVRLRDSAARENAFQVRIGQGDVEYSKIITQLDRCRYDRALTVDVREMPNNQFPVEPEVRKLKYLLESMV